MHACMHMYIDTYICARTHLHIHIYFESHIENPYAQYMFIQYLCGIGLKYVA